MSNYTTTITLPNGRRKWIRGKTREEVEKKKAVMMVRVGQGLDILNESTFGEFSEIWVETYKRPYLREKSMAAIENALRNHILPVIGNVLLKNVSPLQVQMILSGLSGKSRTLNNQVVQVMRGIFNTAVDNGLLLKSPITANLRVGGIQTKEKDCLTVEQSEMLLDAVKGTRAYLFCLIALKTGMRKGEILGLQWQDVDLESRTIHVRHNAVLMPDHTTVSEELKTNAARRDLPIPESLAAELERKCGRRKAGYVIQRSRGGAMNASSFAKLMKLIQIRTTDDPRLLGEPIDSRHPDVRYGIDFRVTAHLLRHTYITRLFEAGLDVKEIQYLAGHTTMALTLQVYTHYQQESRRNETAQKVCTALQ